MSTPDPRPDLVGHDVDPHGWFRSRLDANAAGLLSEGDQRRFDDHAVECSACHRALVFYSESLPAPEEASEHLPSGLAARWEETKRELRGYERTLVREHLERCETCREGLTVLGFDPVLIQNPLLEGTVAKQPESIHPPEIRATQHAAARRRSSWRERFGDWAMGGAVGALATAAAVLIILPVLRDDQPAPLPNLIGMPSEGRARLTLTITPETGKLRGPLRASDAPETTVVVADTSIRAISFRIPDVLASLDTPVQVQVNGPEGSLIAEALLSVRDFKGGTLLLESGSHPLAFGDYVVVTTVGPDPNDLAGGRRSVPSVLRLSRVADR